MRSVSDRLLGMELDEAKALLQLEGVAFVVDYTEANRKKDMFQIGEGKHRIVRVRDKDGLQELTVCIV